MEWILYSYMFLLGICFGSFGNVIVYRIPANMSIIKPRSSCVSCGSVLGWTELVPIIGWLIVKGKCKKCESAISVQYPLVEFLCGILFVVMVLKFGITVSFVLNCVVVYMMMIIALIDFKEFEVYDILVFIIGIVGMLMLVINGISWDNLKGHILAVVVVILPMFLANLITKIKFKNQVFGNGDILLLLALSLFFDWRYMLIILYFAFVVGGCVSLLLLGLKKLKKGDKVPFVPFLFVGVIIAQLVGDLILKMSIWSVII